MKRIEIIEHIVDCTACPLHEDCTSPVPFSLGTEPIAVVGEAPGEVEDERGQPFIGPAGELLRECLTEAGLDPASLSYINTVSCWPKGTPTPEHVKACLPNKMMQLDFVNPKYVLLLGKVAMKGVRKELELRHGRAKPFEVEGRIYFVAHHPAYILREERHRGTFVEHLSAFAEITRSGQWSGAAQDVCAGCPQDACWWDDGGLGWCEVHLPRAEREKFDRRHEAIGQDYARAAARLRQANAEVRRDDALEAVEVAADPAWMNRAHETLTSYLRSHSEFFVDDFWSDTGLDRPREARALGAVVRRAAQEGLMTKSGEFRKSEASNMTEKPRWTSLIYEGA